MGIQSNQARPSAYIAEHIPHEIDLHPIESDVLHLLPDPLHDFPFLPAFARDGDHFAEESEKIRVVGLRLRQDLLKIHAHFSALISGDIFENCFTTESTEDTEI